MLSKVGIEVAKNLIMMGPKAIYIYDKQIVKVQDLGVNLFCR